MKKIFKVPLSSKISNNANCEIYYHHHKYFILFDNDGELALAKFINPQDQWGIITGKIKMLKLLSINKDYITFIESV